MMKRTIAGAIITAVLLAVPGLGTALANPVVYTETATVGGFLAGVPFSNDVITLSGSGDTANITDGSGLFKNFLPVSFSIAGVVGGTGTFTNPTFVFSNNSGSIGGFSDNTLNAAILLTSNAAFATYDLSTSLSPVSGTATTNQGTAFPTTAGPLVFNFNTTATFSAVPLPATISLSPPASLHSDCSVGAGIGRPKPSDVLADEIK